MSFARNLVRSSLYRRSVAKSTRNVGCLAVEPATTSSGLLLVRGRTATTGSIQSTETAAAATAATKSTTRRGFATGTRGSRGLGWYTNYRAGKGGRHLQGEYFDRDSVDDCLLWNDAILEMGSRQVYMDVIVEPRSSALIRKSNKKEGTVLPENLDSLTGEQHRLVMDLAATVMPETTQNFVDLCLMSSSSSSSETEAAGYKGSLLYRFERNVGICGGDVLTNTGKTGQAAAGSPLTYTVQDDPLAMWHMAGTVTMLVPTVGEIDSRFVLCTEAAPHLDGINRAFGRLTAKSLALVQKWQATLLTRNGVPSSYDLVVVDCGTVDDDNTSSSDDGNHAPAIDRAA